MKFSIRTLKSNCTGFLIFLFITLCFQLTIFIAAGGVMRVMGSGKHTSPTNMNTQ